MFILLGLIYVFTFTKNIDMKLKLSKSKLYGEWYLTVSDNNDVTLLCHPVSSYEYDMLVQEYKNNTSLFVFPEKDNGNFVDIYLVTYTNINV